MPSCKCKAEPEVVFEPIGDRVVLIPDSRETESPGGIALPEGSADKPQVGTVIAYGPGVEQVRLDNRVLFSPYAETVTLNEIEYVLVKEDDLFAILK